MKKTISLISTFSGLILLLSFPANTQPTPSPTVVYLNFEGDPTFPSVTSLRNTSGLAPFTGSAFRLATSERNEVVEKIVAMVRRDFKDFNIRLVTERSALSGDYYTWGIDDKAYIFAVFNSDEKFFDTFRLFGKAGGNPNTDPGDHPRHSRTWAGSFALLPGFDPPEVSVVDIIANVDISTLTVQLPPLAISVSPFEIPFDPFNIPAFWLLFPPITGVPVVWRPSNPPLIILSHCNTDEINCETGWGCGRYNCRPYISLDDISQALANSAAHEISHMFGALHDGEINPATGNPVSVLSMEDLLITEDEWIEGNFNKSFGPDNYNILMSRLGPANPENPELTSPTHSKGQPSCDQILTVEWEIPWAVNGVGGYSYAIVSQDDPFYDLNRTPDDTIDLDASATSFTTPPLEPGHTWEFNIHTVDTNGLWANFYSSFAVEIESCSVEVWVIPREGAVYEVGEWVNIYWGPVSYGGLDVSACYDADLVLMKGPSVIMNIGSNIPNILSYGFRVPDEESGSDYKIRMILDRKSLCDQYSYPESFIGFSNYFSISRPPLGDLDDDGDVDMDDVTVFRDAVGSEAGDDNYNPAADFDGDGRITMNDYRIFRNLLGF